MARLERIIVPIPLMLVIILCVVFLTPAYPVEVHKTRATSPCPPPESCRTYSNYTELEPAALPVLAGFSWSASLSAMDGETLFSYSSSAVAVGILVSMALLISLAVVLKWRDKARRSHLNLRRRYWRGLLWGTGFYFLVLSVHWAWSYMTFYGVVQSSASLDPFLVSLLVTFLLSGLGFSMMMLSVRSRAIWPEPPKDDR